MSRRDYDDEPDLDEELGWETEDDDTGGVEEAEGAISFTFEPLPRSPKLQVKAHLDGRLFYADKVDVGNAKERRKYGEAVIAQLNDTPGVDPERYSLEAIEKALLRHGLRTAEEAGAAAAEKKGGSPGGFQMIDSDDREVAHHGLYRLPPGAGAPEQLTNFALKIERDVDVSDDFQAERRFEGRIKLDGREHPFAITAEAYADSRKLQAAVYAAAGPRAQFLTDAAIIRTAISAVSTPEIVRRTTSHGWDTEGTAYATLNGVVDRDGFREYHDDELRVDLEAEGPHKGLGLARLEADELLKAKKAVVDDFLRLHERRVMFSLLGAVALAVLERFGGASQRPAIWLAGLTGSGKSFAEKLAANFFGDFPVSAGTAFTSWSSTANYVERAGYYYRDALYCVDDYKPETIRPEQAVRVLQGYADGSARGRLQSDATANVSRPIRGLLLSSGEDLPEGSAATLARSIVVPVPNRPKDIARGQRCLAVRRLYPAVTADFIAWMLKNDQVKGFAALVATHQARFYAGIAGKQNDARIASNFALLAAAFEEIAVYLADAWPEHAAETKAFVEKDLIQLRDEMIARTTGQQASEIFIITLYGLLERSVVTLQRYPQQKPEHGEIFVGTRMDSYQPVVHLALDAALKAVQQQLRGEGRPELKVTRESLVDQLIEAGIAAPEAKGSGRRRRIGGRQLRCIDIPAEILGLEVKRSS
jgi:hypothetical protein